MGSMERVIFLELLTSERNKFIAMIVILIGD